MADSPTRFFLQPVETRVGPVALVTMDNGEDWQKPNTFGRGALESLSEAAEARHALLDLFRDGQKRFGGLGRRNAVATAIEQRRRQRFF